MPTYTYNNGNFSSTTNIVNGVAYTQNIMMLNSTGNGCGDSPCPQGYSLYFPCLKNITRGEDVCFDFYVVDNVTKDVVDLRKVDAISITLTGNFGCTLGTYTYPSDDGYIRPLQKIEYKHILEEGFKEREKFNLNVVSVDTDLEEISESNINGKIGSYYEGDTVVLEAYDTESYIFVGWVDLDSELDDECDDYYYSTNHRIVFKIYSDKNLAAIYKKRETYTIEFDTKNSLFNYYYRNKEYELLENRITVKEGEFIIVRSIPVNCIFSKWNMSGLKGCWHTDEKNIVMQICVKSNIRLKIDSIDVPTDFNEESDSDSENMNPFDLNFVNFTMQSLISLCNIDINKGDIKEHNLERNVLTNDIVFSPDTDISKMFVSCTPIDYNNLYCYHSGTNTMLRFGNENENGYLSFLNPVVENETVIEVYCTKYNNEVCSISVKLDDDEQQVQELYDSGINILTFRFDNIDFKTITISSVGEVFPEEKSGICFVDKIIVSDSVIIDKGKATLCLPGSVTSTFHRGKITATGAIMVGGKSYGLPCTMIGNVSGNPIINQIII